MKTSRDREEEKENENEQLYIHCTADWRVELKKVITYKLLRTLSSIHITENVIKCQDISLVIRWFWQVDEEWKMKNLMLEGEKHAFLITWSTLLERVRVKYLVLMITWGIYACERSTSEISSKQAMVLMIRSWKNEFSSFHRLEANASRSAPT
jgi:hypothetical protein